jgi:hypothetical protein
MKTRPDNQPVARRENASIAIIFIALLMIMMILVMAESRALSNLHQEIKLLERDQAKRLGNPPAAAVAVNATPEKNP